MIPRSNSEEYRKRNKARPPRILVVDDHWTIRDFLKTIIRHWCADAVVICRAKGEAAWRELQRKQPDLLITDMNRFGMNGYEMLRLLARRRVGFPILVISGLATEEDVQSCAGPNLVVSFLPKPFSFDEFRGELSRYLGAGDKPRRRC
jgi:CheY-like chemotaxis protein